MKIPVTILSGFLGSGKTSLLNRILAAHPNGRIAVLENEFGEIAVDTELISAIREDIIELTNGCVCCTVRGDLSGAFETLGERIEGGDHFDRVLIETTGLADPGPVAQVFLIEGAAKERFRLDAVVTVVDARQMLDGINDRGESKAQIALADVLVVNKTDLASTKEVEGLERWLETMNPGAKRLRALHADVPMKEIIDIEAFDMTRAAEASGEVEAGFEHDDAIGSVGLRLSGDLDRDRFTSWIAGVLSRSGPRLLRVKGILAFAGDDKRCIFDAVQMLNDLREGREWKNDPRESKIVFIGHDLDREDLKSGFEECVLL
ncbi:MAG: cobalamin biosynthesis protein CobW [Elusimicrobia bacterium]|nr:MAG: cobalamin biosynthesis protein CobW [Elusimicrobiota bacterium]